jgi:hypothetical protein
MNLHTKLGLAGAKYHASHSKNQRNRKKRGDETCNAAGLKITRRFPPRKRGFNKRFHPFTSCKIIHHPMDGFKYSAQRKKIPSRVAVAQQQFAMQMESRPRPKANHVKLRVKLPSKVYFVSQFLV